VNDQPQQPGRGRLWLAIGAVVLATLAAVWMVPDDKPGRPREIPAPPSPPSEPAENPASEEGGAPAEAPAQPEAEVETKKAPEGAAARAWLAEAGDPAAVEITAKAREFQRAGRLADAWLLYFKAAREGDPAAAMALAEQADPAFYDPARSALARPDLVQAHKWYARALALGAEEARSRLKGVLERLARRASQGDEAAALLLQEWRNQ